MKKIYLIGAVFAAAITVFFVTQKHTKSPYEIEMLGEGEEEGYDNPAARDSLEYLKTVDPALGYVPYERLDKAIDYSIQLMAEEENLADQARRVGRRTGTAGLTINQINWQERGPIRDIVGPSNGNLRGTTRANLYYTSGRVRAVMTDLLNDPTGNTVFAAGVSGGLWKTTNFLANETPNWQVVNDFFANMAINSICQDPTNPQIMYFSTGEATSNADAVFGAGFWKSTDGGTTWNRLSSTSNFLRTFKIVCDNNGYVYAGLRPTLFPREQPYSVVRSKDGGQTWENISPVNITSGNSTCTDIELSNTGRMHISIGYLGAAGTIVNHLYTDDPSGVGPTSWTRSTGIRINSTVTARRMELAVNGDIVYAATVASTDRIDSVYRSDDGGATFTRQNPSLYSSALNIGQAWYNLTLAINPTNTNEIMLGGVDAVRSTNAGATATRATAWVAVEPYVHADHHFMEWRVQDGLNTVIIGGDGGLFVSRDNGVTWVNKNENWGIKQFYSAAIHPEAGNPYLLAGAQDNGSHQISTPGLSQSVEVTGGDGAFVHINQLNPNIQFTSFVFNQYRRSTNGGVTWGGANFNPSAGFFINPFDVDDNGTIMYASWAAPSILRWPNAGFSGSAVLLSIPALGTARLSAFKVSPYTAGRLYTGSENGRLFRIENANSIVGGPVPAENLTELTNPGFRGFLNCIEVGKDDDHLVAIFSNYGVNNVWYSEDGGASWAAVDGDLPDMPIRWAQFHPQYNTKLILATEAGIYTTDAVSGNQTKWKVSPDFPLVRTDMIKIRKNDFTLVAGTHGRGLFTGTVPHTTDTEIYFTRSGMSVTEVSESTDASNQCRGYKDYAISLSILNNKAGGSNATVQVSGGTAVRGVDYEISNDPAFTGTGTEVTFPEGSSENQMVYLRVYDDGEVEDEENISLEIIPGADVFTGTPAQFTITIADNDYLPLPVVTVQQRNVGIFNSQIVNTSPFAGNREKHRLQSLFYASELAAAGIKPGMPISALNIEVLKKYSTAPFSNMTVSLAMVPNTTLVTGFVPATFTDVFSGSYNTQEGLNRFEFNNSFVWDGTSNLIVQFCVENTGGALAIFPDFVAGNTYPLLQGTRASTYSNVISSATDVCSLPANLVADNRMNVAFEIVTPATPIATTISSNTQYLNVGNDIYYYNAAGDLMARVRNLGTRDERCTKVDIDRVGNGATKFMNSNRRDFLADKTYLITPGTTGNGAGPYEVTLYYTNAEKVGWEAATTNMWSQAQMVRTSGRIANVTAANAQPNNNGTVREVVNATHGSFGSGFSVTGVFKNLAGGFGVGMPGRQFNNMITNAGVNIESNEDEQRVQVLTNPFTNEIRVAFAKPLAPGTAATLVDLGGRQLLRQPLQTGATTAVIRTGTSSAAFSSQGIYFLQIREGNRTYVTRLMKQ